MQRARTIGTGHVMVPPRTARWRGSVRGQLIAEAYPSGASPRFRAKSRA
jgi:hypothetical protein